MTARDRLVLMIVAALAIVGAAYLLVVSPERKEASKVSGEVSLASSRLASAESKLAEAHQAQIRYSAAYASIVTLGKAVPTSEEVPSLIYQLAQATHQKNVDFSSIASGSGAGGAPAISSPAEAAASASAAFTQMPFTFVFTGTYADLEKLFAKVDSNVVRRSTGQLQVNGRLLTIQSVKLGPLPSAGSPSQPSNHLSGTITATAYVLPASQGLTAGATAQGPAGAATPASSTTSGSTAAPAVARVTP
jgi:Tfp pilus assembly protein PilO